MCIMKTNRPTLIDQIRQAVNAAGVSRYAICKAGGISEAVMSRFMAGKTGLSMESLNAIADVLQLRIVAEGPPLLAPPAKLGRKPKAKKGR